MLRRLTRLALLALALLAPVAAAAQDAKLPTIEVKTRGMVAHDGFLPLYWDAAAGKLWLEIPRMGEEMLYLVSLPSGLGSNDVGLDRGQLGSERVVRFERVGPKVLLVQPNLRYRADSTDPAEVRGVEESFAKSILWGFTVAAQTGDRVLVDATDFALHDAHEVARTLRRSRQGSFKLDASRSALFLDNLKSFPKNSVMEATLTFTADSAGGWVRQVTPTPEAVTVRERQAFVQLPPPGYEPRVSDPRAGYFAMEYEDLTAHMGEPRTKRFIARHRLECSEKRVGKLCVPKEPLVYYVDAGAPEPIRSALVEGASWWNDAFEAAGFKDAFRVEVLPADADPMDVRYNVIQWVHRATRGWSYGASVTDPRTGEIIQGHVTLGSGRARQDYLLAEGLLAPYATGTETPAAVREMVLGRIRQLAAHETGHTLGLAHNFVASTRGNGSVMDYPYPQVRLDAQGKPDLSEPYSRGVSDWDRAAIAYGYTEFAPGVNEEAALDSLVRTDLSRGLLFLSDQDARPFGSAHPQTHLWDNGTSAAAELTRLLKVRDAALERFGERVIQTGEPLATIEEALVPIYLFHRYQMEAASKAIGGEYYTYALRGDGQEPLRPVPAAEQEAALSAMLATLAPAELTLPRPLLAMIPPRPYGYGAHRELFDRYTGMTFDAVAPAAVVSDLAVSLILQPERAARLVEQHALDPSLPGLGRVMDRLVGAAFDAPIEGGYEAAVSRATQRSVADGLMGLAFGASMPQVRAMATLKLTALRDRLQVGSSEDSEAERAHRLALAQEIGRFLERPYAPTHRTPTLDLPPGAPIGAEAPAWIP